MKNKIPCEVVKDLFPSYIDELTSGATNELIEEHVAGCESCRGVLEAMKGGPSAGAEPDEGKAKEIDFLKKNRKRNRRVVLISVISAAAVIFGIFFTRTYLVGQTMYGNWVASDVKVTGNHIRIEGEPVENFHAVSNVEFQETEDGEVWIETKAVRASVFHFGGFSEEYTASQDVDRVYVNGEVVWEKGEKISSYAACIFNVQHDFIGDAPANGALADEVGLQRYFGDYTSELKTDAAPYTWIIRLEADIAPGNRAAAEKDMDSCAYVLIASVENLDQVTFEYTVSGGTASKTITKEDATKFLGRNIKDCFGSASLLDQLVRKAGLSG